MFFNFDLGVKYTSRIYFSHLVFFFLYICSPLVDIVFFVNVTIFQFEAFQQELQLKWRPS